MDREIDHCIICNAKEPGNEFSLSNRLNARLEYVTGTLPDLSDIGILFGGRVSSPGISNNGGFSPGFSVGEDDVSPWILNDEGSNSGISNVEDISPGMLVIDEDASSRISNNEEVYSPSVSNYEGDGSGMPNGDVGSPEVPNGDEAGSPGMSNEDAGSPGMPNGEAGSPGTPNGEAGSPEMLNGEAGDVSPEMPNDEEPSPRTPNIGGSPSGVSNNGGNSPRISNDEDDSRLDENPPSVKSISSVSSLSDTDLLCHSEDTISAVISPSQQGIQTPTSIQSSLETFFVLKLVFQHPLDHVTTEVMMLLVQSPADWFEICPSCRALVGEGIEMVNALRENHNKEKREHKELSEKLESNLLHLRSKFLYSMFQRICLVSWEFLDLEDFANINTINFLKTEAEAVLSFRHILLTTALQRVVNLVNVSQLALPIQDCIMDFNYSPAYSPEILIDSDSPDYQSDDHPEEMEHEIGLPDWFARFEEEFDDGTFCDCMHY